MRDGDVVKLELPYDLVDAVKSLLTQLERESAQRMEIEAAAAAAEKIEREEWRVIRAARLEKKKKRAAAPRETPAPLPLPKDLDPGVPLFVNRGAIEALDAELARQLATPAPAKPKETTDAARSEE